MVISTTAVLMTLPGIFLVIKFFALFRPVSSISTKTTAAPHFARAMPCCGPNSPPPPVIRAFLFSRLNLHDMNYIIKYA